MKNHPPGPIHPMAGNAVIHEAIAARAYELWDRAGRPENQADTFWLAAEQEQMAAGREPQPIMPVPELLLPVSF